MRKNNNTNEEGELPYKSPVNLRNIHQLAADNVTSYTTVKHNTCSFDNKYCEKLWIAVYNQSATVTYMPVHHYKTISRHGTLVQKLPED
jgi:hypothetical protein